MTIKVFNTFEFVGSLEIRKETEKFKPYTKETFGSGWTKEKLMLNVKSDDSSMLVTLEDGYFSQTGYKIKKKGIGTKKEDGTFEKGSDLEIAWKDRLNKSVVDKVANYQKYILDFSNNKERYDLRKTIENIEKIESFPEDEKAEIIKKCNSTYETDIIEELKAKLKTLEEMKHEFLSRVDMIEMVRKEMSKNSNSTFKTTGNIAYSEWNGKVYRTFEVTKIEKALESDKKLLKGQLDLYFNENSLNEEAFEDTKKYYINAFTKSYDSQLKKDIYLPISLVMDASKLDLNNPKHKAKVNMLINPLRVDGEEFFQLQYIVKFARGSEKKELTIEDLTEFQRQCVEVGLKTFDEIKRELGGNKFGDRVDETRLTSINIKDFPNGREETDLTIEDMAINREQLDSSKESVSENDVISEDEEDVEDLI